MLAFLTFLLLCLEKTLAMLKDWPLAHCFCIVDVDWFFSYCSVRIWVACNGSSLVQLMLLSALFLQKYLSSEPNNLHQVLNRPLLCITDRPRQAKWKELRLQVYLVSGVYAFAALLSLSMVRTDLCLEGESSHPVDVLIEDQAPTNSLRMVKSTAYWWEWSCVFRSIFRLLGCSEGSFYRSRLPSPCGGRKLSWWQMLMLLVLSVKSPDGWMLTRCSCGYEDIFNRDPMKMGSQANIDDDDGLIDGSSVYKLKDGQGIALTNSVVDHHNQSSRRMLSRQL